MKNIEQGLGLQFGKDVVEVNAPTADITYTPGQGQTSLITMGIALGSAYFDQQNINMKNKRLKDAQREEEIKSTYNALLTSEEYLKGDAVKRQGLIKNFRSNYQGIDLDSVNKIIKGQLLSETGKEITESRRLEAEGRRITAEKEREAQEAVGIEYDKVRTSDEFLNADDVEKGNMLKKFYNSFTGDNKDYARHYIAGSLLTLAGKEERAATGIKVQENQKMYYDVITSEGFLNANAVDQRSMLEELLQATLNDDESNLIMQKLVSPKYTALSKEVKKAEKIVTLNNISADANLNIVDIDDFEKYVIDTARGYPDIPIDEIRDSVMFGYLKKITEDGMYLQTPEELAAFEATQFSVLLKMNTDKFLTTASKKTQEAIKIALKQVGDSIKIKKKEFANVAKAQLTDIGSRYDSAEYKDMPLNEMDVPYNSDIQDKLNRAYPGKPDERAAAEVRISNKQQAYKDKVQYSQYNHPDEPNEYPPAKEAQPMWENKITQEGTEAFSIGDLDKLVNIATYQRDYVGDLGKQLQQEYFNIQTQEELAPFVANIKTLITMPMGATAVKAMFGDQMVAEMLVTDALANYAYGGDLKKAREEFHRAEANISPDTSRIDKDFMEDTIKKQQQVLGPMLGGLYTKTMEYVAIATGGSDTRVKRLEPEIREYFQSMIVETDAGNVNTYNGVPKVFAESTELSLDTLKYKFPHIKDMDTFVSVGKDNLMVIDDQGFIVDTFNLSNMDTDIRGYQDYRMKRVPTAGDALSTTTDLATGILGKMFSKFKPYLDEWGDNLEKLPNAIMYGVDYRTSGQSNRDAAVARSRKEKRDAARTDK